MRKSILRALALLTATLSLGLTACGGHTHQFIKKDTAEAYLQANATCESAASYYYSCSCGKKGEQTFTSGLALPTISPRKSPRPNT